MGANKNFVVKNGLEVNDNLILADASTKNVGIGSTVPSRTLDVSGGIGVTYVYSSGISTFADDVEVSKDLTVGLSGTVFTALGVGGSVGVGTNLPGYLLEVRSPVSTGQTALYVYGDVRISGDIKADDVFFDDLVGSDLHVSGIGTIATLESGRGNITSLISENIGAGIATITNIRGTTLSVAGFSTFVGFSTFGNDVYVVGVVTATSFHGSGAALTGLPAAGVGLQTAGGFIGAGVTILDFRGAGISSVTISSGIGTLFITGGGGGSGSISISTAAPSTPTSGDLWYSPDYARTFIWYDESTVGYGTSSNWVDAAPSNGGSGSGGARVSISTDSPTSPNNGDLWFSVDLGRTFIYYDEPTVGVGSTSVWVDAAPNQPAGKSLTVGRRSQAVELNIIGIGLTLSLRSGIGTASF